MRTGRRFRKARREFELAHLQRLLEESRQRLAEKRYCPYCAALEDTKRRNECKQQFSIVETSGGLV